MDTKCTVCYIRYVSVSKIVSEAQPAYLPMYVCMYVVVSLGRWRHFQCPDTAARDIRRHINLIILCVSMDE